MLILHVLFSSRIAGAERYCLDLANRQAAAGHDVHVAGMRSSALAAHLSSRVRFHGFGPLLRGFLLRRLVNHLSPDICHGHLSPACEELGRLPARQATVATLHVGYEARQHGRLAGLICVNRAQGGRLASFRGIARTIPNWLPATPPATVGRSIREELGLGDEVMLIGSVGRLHPSKGMDVLISAFRATAPAGVALVILGEGPHRPVLERLASGDPRIHLTGYRPNVHDCLHELDLFVSPSREESFGLAILEAMSTGVPVIATAAEGPAEFLRDQPAVLVAPGSAVELGSALTAAFIRFAREGLPKVGYDLSYFDPGLRVSSITSFYEQVIERRQWGPSQATGRVPAAS